VRTAPCWRKFQIWKTSSAYTKSKKQTDHLDCLVRLNLNVHFVRGQGYDGAAVMAGARSGVAAKITALEHRAVYIHCAGHTLNLALQDSVKHITVVRDTLDLTRELVNFIRCSPKRCRLFDDIKQLVPAADASTSPSSLSLPHKMDSAHCFVVISCWQLQFFDSDTRQYLHRMQR